MREQIQQLISKFPNNLEIITENKLYLYNEHYENSIKERVFFNFSNEIPVSDEYNEVNEYLESFQEKFISPRYYQDRGSIQWNYYTVFVVNRVYDENIISKIEKNKDYTRKIVLQKDKFNHFLERGNFVQEFYSTETDLAPNLINQWDAQISANNLNFICDGIYKKNWIEKLLEESEALDDNEELILLADNNTLETRFPENSFINRLYLGGYRSYPIERNFDFSKVNLIHGVNGSGKTSLLESIEALTCGKIQRDPYENDFRELALFFNETQLSWIDSPMIYKNRDKEWYSSTNEGQNKLYENFNRFNFYHADAANKISNDGNIDKIVKDIVLGKDVAKYEKNISDAIEEFKKEDRRIESKYIPSLKHDIDNISQQIKTINYNKTLLNEIEAKFKKHIELINWKKQINDYEKIQDLLLEIKDVKMIVKEIYTLSNEIELTDISNIDEKEALFSKDYKILEESIKNISDENREKDEFIKKVNSLSSKIANIDKLSQWILIDEVSQIIGLDDQILLNQKSLSILESIFKNEELNKGFESYLENDSKLFDYIDNLKSELEDQKSEFSDLGEQLDTKEKDIGALSSYKTNLQEFTIKTMHLVGNKEKCPVCHSTFTEKELSDLIENITKNIEGREEVKELRSKIEFLEKEITLNSSELTIVEEVYILVEKLSFDEKNTNILIKDAIELINSSYIQMKILKDETKKLIDLKNFFSSKGITEHEYKKLLDAYSNGYLNNYGEISAENLSKIKNKYILEITTQKDTIEKFDQKIANYNKIIDDIKKSNEIFIEKYQELINYFLNLLQKIKQIKQEKEKLLLHFIPNNFNIDNIKKEVDELTIVSSQYSETLLQFNKSSTLETQLKQEYDLKIEEHLKNIDNKEKIEGAIALLEGLVSSETILEDFFNRNTNTILDVFMTIHAPKEFNDLKFEDSMIKLKRQSNNEWIGVNKISTGQKSALALAIFLVMNRNATRAPKYILFDDPVSNTDDINILAFFDFLRDISLSGERQIFFVTANSKVANLFRKKFDFLGEDFRYYYLER